MTRPLPARAQAAAEVDPLVIVDRFQELQSRLGVVDGVERLGRAVAREALAIGVLGVLFLYAGRIDEQQPC